MTTFREFVLLHEAAYKNGEPQSFSGMYHGTANMSKILKSGFDPAFIGSGPYGDSENIQHGMFFSSDYSGAHFYAYDPDYASDYVSNFIWKATEDGGWDSERDWDRGILTVEIDVKNPIYQTVSEHDVDDRASNALWRQKVIDGNHDALVTIKTGDEDMEEQFDPPLSQLEAKYKNIVDALTDEYNRLPEAEQNEVPLLDDEWHNWMRKVRRPDIYGEPPPYPVEAVRWMNSVVPGSFDESPPKVVDTPVESNTLYGDIGWVIVDAEDCCDNVVITDAQPVDFPWDTYHEIAQESNENPGTLYDFPLPTDYADIDLFSRDSGAWFKKVGYKPT